MWASIIITVALFALMLTLLNKANGKGVGSEAVLALFAAVATAISFVISVVWILINIGRWVGP